MLYLCATPIGNLEDISYRAVRVLGECDEIWCEDTRRSGQLLQHLGIKKPLLSCHTHTEKSRCALLVEKLSEGKEIVYLSDAGMPGISDPGAVLLHACREAGYEVTVLPGASAVLMAAVLSDLPVQPFSFYGFLPRDNRDRKPVLDSVRSCGHLAILYESPHRVKATLKELLELLGDCPAALCRELTKLHEECRKGPLSELIASIETEVRGECVLCVLVPPMKKEAEQQDLDTLLLQLMATLSTKDAAAQAAKALSISKKEAYRRALELGEKQEL